MGFQSMTVTGAFLAFPTHANLSVLTSIVISTVQRYGPTSFPFPSVPGTREGNMNMSGAGCWGAQGLEGPHRMGTDDSAQELSTCSRELQKAVLEESLQSTHGRWSRGSGRVEKVEIIKK